MISGVASNTTYYYRVFASNSYASASTSIGSFITVPSRELTISTMNSLTLLSLDIAVVILVRAQGISRTGERYQLTCSITHNNGIAPTITWVNSDQQITSNRSGITLGPQMDYGNSSSSSVLIFDPLTVGHEGNYTCQATFGATVSTYTYTLLVSASE